MQYQKYLQKIGFGTHEASVYLALLEIGQTNVGPLVDKTKLHRQQVYTALASLEERGFASHVLKNNRKLFQAAHPNELNRIVEEQEKAVQALVPALEALQSDRLDSIEVKTLYGQRGFLDNLRDMVRSAAQSDGKIRIIGGAKDTDFYRILGDQYNEYVSYLQEHHVRKYLIAPAHFSEAFKQKFAKESGNVLKTLELGLTSPSYTRITRDMVSFEIYATEVTVVQIRNQAIARGYLDHFNLLWKEAKK